ncbi:unnamed protein product [Orchesella dallaii]|uniref:Uncharacterized protein n=1 Tax=Orchesella dallaii TaxID=48710 RepID=A0ABP1PVM9_9HEXA
MDFSMPDKTFSLCRQELDDTTDHSVFEELSTEELHRCSISLSNKLSSWVMDLHNCKLIHICWAAALEETEKEVKMDSWWLRVGREIFKRKRQVLFKPKETTFGDQNAGPTRKRKHKAGEMKPKDKNNFGRVPVGHQFFFLDNLFADQKLLLPEYSTALGYLSPVCILQWKSTACGL